jgi:hypothetical protein
VKLAKISGSAVGNTGTLGMSSRTVLPSNDFTENWSAFLSATVTGPMHRIRDHWNSKSARRFVGFSGGERFLSYSHSPVFWTLEWNSRRYRCSYTGLGLDIEGTVYPLNSFAHAD